MEEAHSESEGIQAASEEAERLWAVRMSGLLDRSARRELADVVGMAVRVTGASMAAVTLIDADTQHLLVNIGSDVDRLPRDVAFCNYTIRSPELLVVPDTLDDPRFAHNPLVTGEPHLRSYAGMPVHMANHRIGTLCVFDQVPREMAEEQLDGLKVLARQVDRLIELHWRRGLSAPPSAETVRRLGAAIRCAEDFDAVVGSLALSSWITDASTHRFIRVNEAMVEHYGFTAEELSSMSMLDLHPAREAHLAQAALSGGAALEETLGDRGLLAFWNGRRFLHRRKDGVQIEVRVVMADVEYESRPARFAIAVDVTASAQLEAAAGEAAAVDPLTGFGNRRRLEALLETLVDGTAPTSLVLVDLDRFRMVNDTAGHRRGDEVLVAAAARLPPMVPDRSVLTRSGGDAFVVVLPSTSEGEATRISERLRERLADPYLVGAGEFRLTASIGVSTTRDDMSAAELLARADDAAFDAKQAGGNRVVVSDDATRRRHLTRSRTGLDLAAAVERRELELHYQPMVELDGPDRGLVKRVEALIRWNRGKGWLVSPSDFLEVAEDVGLMASLGWWVVHEACAAAARWRASGRDTTVAVNCSAPEFTEQFVDAVADALTCSRLPGRNLTVEITESALCRDEAVAEMVTSGLGELGVRVAIDDFGVGYSFLGRLSDLPVAGLKIDRSLLLGMGRPRGRGLYKALVDMAFALDLEVTAEGIETPGELGAVMSLGCDLGQGFLLGVPVPEDRVPVRTQFPKAASAQRP